jgi:hypothetical protein
MDHMHSVCKLTQVDGLLDCRVATPHHSNLLIAVEGSIAYRTIGYTSTRKFGFSLYPELVRGSSAGQDNRL